MRKVFYSFLLLISFNLCKSQDLIITITDDSLNCKITQIQKEQIYFFYEREGNIIESSMPVNMVKSYEKNYYALPNNSLEKARNRDKFKLGVYGGYSRMIGKLPDNIDPILQEHLDRLRNGFHLGGDINFFVSKNLALGAKYSFFRTEDAVDNIGFFDTSGMLVGVGKIAERVLVHYIAPNIFLKVGKTMGKVFFIFDGSFGCMIYRNYATFLQEDFTMKGIALGVSIVPGVEVKLSQNIGLNFSLGLNVGTLNTMTMTSSGQTTTNNDARENISRLDVSLGLHWYK